MRQCIKCKKRKADHLFKVNNTTRLGEVKYKNTCIKCSSNNSKILKRIKKQINIKHQKKCAICSSKKDLCYDHCHETNMFRGFLCRTCNTAIGKFKDNIHLLKKAIEYLEGKMKITNHDNKEIKLDLKNSATIDQNRPRSELHLKARNLLRSLFPSVQICEEVAVELSKGKTVYLDFFIPSISLVVEVNGEQHFKFTPFFHKTKSAFAKAKQLDKDKKLLCEMNNLYCVELNYNEDLEKWKQKIENR